MIVKALLSTPVELFGLVTRTLQAWVPNDLSTLVLTVITIVVGLTTCACVTCGATPLPPSKVTTEPLTKPEPVIVTFRVVSAGAVLGTIFVMVGCGVDAIVALGSTGTVAVGRTAVGGTAVGGGTVGEGGNEVIVGKGVVVITMIVGGAGVNVNVADGTGVGNVGEGKGEAVGVMMMGLPNSLQPRSGAAPIKPASGLRGTGSPLTVTYWGTPLSIAGELPWSNKPLKSSSTVCHAPSGPGFGAAAKSGS